MCSTLTKLYIDIYFSCARNSMQQNSFSFFSLCINESFNILTCRIYPRPFSSVYSNLLQLCWKHFHKRDPRDQYFPKVVCIPSKLEGPSMKMWFYWGRMHQFQGNFSDGKNISVTIKIFARKNFSIKSRGYIQTMYLTFIFYMQNCSELWTPNNLKLPQTGWLCLPGFVGNEHSVVVHPQNSWTQASKQWKGRTPWMCQNLLLHLPGIS